MSDICNFCEDKFRDTKEDRLPAYCVHRIDVQNAIAEFYRRHPRPEKSPEETASFFNRIEDERRVRAAFNRRELIEEYKKSGQPVPAYLYRQRTFYTYTVKDGKVEKFATEEPSNEGSSNQGHEAPSHEEIA